MRGNETKLYEEKAHGKEPWSLAQGTTFCVKSLDLLEGRKSIPLPATKFDKSTESVGGSWLPTNA